MSQTHQINVKYDREQVLASWSCDGQDPNPCLVQPGDRIAFSFTGPGEIAESVLIVGQMSGKHTASPFIEGNRINLVAQPTVTVGPENGLWGFTISFSARNPDASTAFYFLPDPELQVGST